MDISERYAGESTKLNGKEKNIERGNSHAEAKAVGDILDYQKIKKYTFNSEQRLKQLLKKFQGKLGEAKKGLQSALLNKYIEFSPKATLMQKNKIDEGSLESYKITLSNGKTFLLKIAEITSASTWRISSVIADFFLGKSLGAITNYIAKSINMNIEEKQDNTRIEILLNSDNELFNIPAIIKQPDQVIQFAYDIIQMLSILEEHGLGILNLTIDDFAMETQNNINKIKLINLGKAVPLFHLKGYPKQMIQYWVETFRKQPNCNISPELLIEDKFSIEKSEVFSFGGILKALLSGQNIDLINSSFAKKINSCCDVDPNKRPSLMELKHFFDKEMKIDIKQNLYDDIPSIDYKIMGDTYYLMGNYEASLWFYELYISLLKSIKNPFERQVDKNLAKVYIKIGLLYSYLSDFKNAIKYGEDAKEIMENIYGNDGEEMIEIYKKLGELFTKLQNFNKAIAYFQKQLLILEKVHENSNPEIAISYNNIGFCYSELDEYSIAMELHTKALNMQRQLYKSENQYLAETYNYLAIANIKQNNLDAAMDCCNQSINILNKLDYKFHKDIAAVNVNMGVALKNKGEIESALKIHHHISENFILNPEEIAMIYSNLGIIYRLKKDYKNAIFFIMKANEFKNMWLMLGSIYKEMKDIESAILCFEKAEESPIKYLELEDSFKLKRDYRKAEESGSKMEEEYGKFLENKSTIKLQTIKNKGIYYWKIGEYNKAIGLFKNSEDYAIQAYGKINTELTDIYYNFGILYNERAEYDKALEYFLKSEQLISSVFPKDNASLISLNMNISTTYKNLGNNTRAIDYLLKAEHIQKSYISKENNPVLAKIFNNLGNTYLNMKMYEKSIEYHEKALHIRESFYGPNHPDVGISFNNIGISYYRLSKYFNAISFSEKATNIWQKSHNNFAKEHLAYAYDNQGLALTALNQQKKAIELHLKAESLKKQTFGETHICLAETYINLGKAYNSMKDYNAAIIEYNKALDICKTSQIEISPLIANVYYLLGLQYYNIKDFSKGIENCIKSEQMWIKLNGNEQEELANAYCLLALLMKNDQKLEKSIEYYTKAEALFGKIEGLSENKLLFVIQNLADYFLKNKQNVLAIEYLKKLEIKLQSEDKKLKLYKEIENIYNSMGLYSKAADYSQKMLEIQKRINEPSLLERYSHLGMLYIKAEEYKKALKIYEENENLLTMSLDNKGNLAELYENYGLLYTKLHNLEKALFYHEKANLIKKSIFEQNHFSFGENYMNIGVAYSEAKEFAKAFENFVRAEELLIDTKGPKLIRLHSQMAEAYARQNNMEGAKAFYQKAIGEFNKIQGSKNIVQLAGLYIKLGLLEKKLGDKQAAASNFWESLQIYCTNFGEEHLTVVNIYEILGELFGGEEQAKYKSRAAEIKKILSSA